MHTHTSFFSYLVSCFHLDSRTRWLLVVHHKEFSLSSHIMDLIFPRTVNVLQSIGDSDWVKYVSTSLYGPCSILRPSSLLVIKMRFWTMVPAKKPLFTVHVIPVTPIKRSEGAKLIVVNLLPRSPLRAH